MSHTGRYSQIRYSPPRFSIVPGAAAAAPPRRPGPAPRPMPEPTTARPPVPRRPARRVPRPPIPTGRASPRPQRAQGQRLDSTKFLARPTAALVTPHDRLPLLRRAAHRNSLASTHRPSPSSQSNEDNRTISTWTITARNDRLRNSRRVPSSQDPPAAAPADLDIDGKEVLESLRPRQSPVPVGSRWLAALLGLVGSGGAGLRTIRARRREHAVIPRQVGECRSSKFTAANAP